MRQRTRAIVYYHLDKLKCMHTQHCECTKCHRIEYNETGDLFCDFDLNKNKQTNKLFKKCMYMGSKPAMT